MKVVVRTVLHESDLEAVPRTSIREIFSLISKSLGIQEVWYFGLMYYGHDAEEIWVEQSKKALKDLKNHSTNLHYKVKYYPEDIGEELIESITIEFFFLQVKLCILSDEIYCPADTCVLLASYALQVKYGDYSPDTHNKDILQKQKLLPDRLRTQFSMGATEWNKNIENMWVKHKGLDKEEAMLEYLKLVQNLEMYGVTYFNITNKKGTNLLLGVTALGLNIYKTEDRKKYYNEKTLREEAEQREVEYKKQIQHMKEEMEKDQKRLYEANLTIKRLQEQLEDLQKSKEELEQQRNELSAMMERLEQSKNMEAAERQKLEEEIRSKHEEVQKIQEEVERRDAEAKRLQEEVEEARRKEEELRRQAEEALRREEEERQRKLEQEELETLPDDADTSLPELQQVNDQLKEQLKLLQSKLEETRQQEQESDLDRIHRINLLEGRDKYKTLADIRRGNTVRRVEMFENM
ncbi:uncharacterized protein isoform X2 [Leptinotarsa decemlineata]|uniref:uncharacterized protein isoform X2 n=1 Tax=Leptinotarsa decemlineata TaxID=7539 RepID=UPI003D30B284